MKAVVIAVNDVRVSRGDDNNNNNNNQDDIYSAVIMTTRSREFTRFI